MNDRRPSKRIILINLLTKSFSSFRVTDPFIFTSWCNSTKLDWLTQEFTTVSTCLSCIEPHYNYSTHILLLPCNAYLFSTFLSYPLKSEALSISIQVPLTLLLLYFIIINLIKFHILHRKKVTKTKNSFWDLKMSQNLNYAHIIWFST